MLRTVLRVPYVLMTISAANCRLSAGKRRSWLRSGKRWQPAIANTARDYIDIRMHANIYIICLFYRISSSALHYVVEHHSNTRQRLQLAANFKNAEAKSAINHTKCLELTQTQARDRADIYKLKKISTRSPKSIARPRRERHTTTRRFLSCTIRFTS
jgi:hypothetical protein